MLLWLCAPAGCLKIGVFCFGKTWVFHWGCLSVHHHLRIFSQVDVRKLQKTSSYLIEYLTISNYPPSTKTGSSNPPTRFHKMKNVRQLWVPVAWILKKLWAPGPLPKGWPWNPKLSDWEPALKNMLDTCGHSKRTFVFCQVNVWRNINSYMLSLERILEILIISKTYIACFEHILQNHLRKKRQHGNKFYHSNHMGFVGSPPASLHYWDSTCVIVWMTLVSITKLQRLKGSDCFF